MIKRTLSPDDQFRLRQDLQRATIAALMQSRRWEPGDIAFQGGTCLSLVHGSIRFSEDLDFMIRGGLSVAGLAKEVGLRMDLGTRMPEDMQIHISTGRPDRNPHAFEVVLTGPEVIGSARVKVELWQTEAQALGKLTLVVHSIDAPSGNPAIVPALSHEEILADKVYALGARERLKPRDVYDLWWLNTGERSTLLDPAKLARRLEIYPQGDVSATAVSWLVTARARLQALAANGIAQAVGADLRRWLPSSVRLDTEVAGAMVQASIEALSNGIQMLEAEHQRLNDRPDLHHPGTQRGG